MGLKTEIIKQVNRFQSTRPHGARLAGICRLRSRQEIRVLGDSKEEREILWQNTYANARLIAAAPELLEACKTGKRSNR